MKVSVIGTRGFPSYYGGFETAVRHIAPYLAKSGWHVVVYGRGLEEKFYEYAPAGSITTKNTFGLNLTSLSTLSFGLTSTIDALIRRPDVCLVMNVANGYYLPILRAARIPTVVNVDGIEWERGKWGRLARAVFKTGAKLTAKYANHLVFDSRVIEQRWTDEFQRKGTFIPYGGTEDEPQGTLPSSLEDGNYVLLVARFVPENSIQEFFAAAPVIAEQMPVVIVGSSGGANDFDAQAAKLADQHDNICWLGHIHDQALLHLLWSKSGVYFHGHTVGGTNPALVQAMALGASCVASDTPFNREVLGRAGVFVEADPRAIAEAVLSVANDPQLRNRLRNGARERARRLYTWEAVCESYRALLTAMR